MRNKKYIVELWVYPLMPEKWYFLGHIAWHPVVVIQIVSSDKYNQYNNVRNRVRTLNGEETLIDKNLPALVIDYGSGNSSNIISLQNTRMLKLNNFLQLRPRGFIDDNAPTYNGGGRPNYRHYLGTIFIRKKDFCIYDIIKDLDKKFKISDYNILTKNCIFYADEFIKSIQLSEYVYWAHNCNPHIPEYIWRILHLGKTAKNFGICSSHIEEYF